MEAGNETVIFFLEELLHRAPVFLYICCGIPAGVLAGALGIGAGILMVPLLLLLLQWQGVHPAVSAHMAVATSLAVMFFIALSSSLSHYLHTGVEGWALRFLAPAMCVGALLGAWSATALAGDTLRALFGVLLLVVALQMWSAWRPPEILVQRPAGGVLALSGAGIGWLSALFGIGGGLLTVPFLCACRVSVHRAVATSACCGVPIALSGALAYIFLGGGRAELPPASIGLVYLPALFGMALGGVLCAPLGALLARRISTRLLRRIFALLLIGIGLRLLAPYF